MCQSLARFPKLFHYFPDSFIGKELPDSVAGHHQKSPFVVELEIENFRLTDHAHSWSNVISKRSTHRKPRDLVVLNPNAVRSNRLPIGCLIRFHSTPFVQNSLSLGRDVRLMVIRHFLDVPLLVLHIIENSSRISDIGTPNMLARNENSDASASTECDIDRRILLNDRIDYLVTRSWVVFEKLDISD